MTKLIKLEIEAITKDYVHYILYYTEKKRFGKEKDCSIYIVHDRFHSILHKTISGTSLMDIVSHNQADVVHAKLMLIIEQGKNEYIFKHETTSKN